MPSIDFLKHAMSKLGNKFDSRSHIVPDSRPEDHWRKQSPESQKAYMQNVRNNWDGKPMVGVDEDWNSPEAIEAQELAFGIKTNVQGGSNSDENYFSSWSNQNSPYSDKGVYSSFTEDVNTGKQTSVFQPTNRTNELDEQGNPIFIQELPPVDVWGRRRTDK